MTAIRLVLMLCAAFVGTLQASSSAAAHASLIRSDPADGSVLVEAPERFVLTFNEPVSPLVLRLVEANGTATALDKVKQAAESLNIEAPGHLGPGTHILSWRVVSEDGHPIAGAIIFSVGAPSETPSRGVGEVSDGPLRIAIWCARIGLYVGLFFGIGGAVFRAWIGYGSRQGQGFALAAMVAGLLSILPAVGLQGVDALAVSFAGLGEARVWLTSLKTSFGLTALLAAMALLLGLISVRMKGKAARALSAAAVLGAGSALAASGHASTAPPQWLTRPVLFVHVTAVSIWAGALVPLAFLLASRTLAALVSLRSFSKAMPFVIGPLVAAGLILAIVQVRDPGAVLGTAYGRILAAKLALVFVLFTLAGTNRWFLTGPAGRSDSGATTLLKWSTLIETILVATILGVVALWRFAPPPRTLSAVQPLAIHMHADKVAAEIRIASDQFGATSASIRITTPDGRELDAKEVTLTLSNQERGIEPIKRAAMKSAHGQWQVQGVAIAVAGRWTVHLDVLVSDFEVLSLEDVIEPAP